MLTKLGKLALAFIGTVLALCALEGAIRLSNLWILPDYSAMAWYVTSNDLHPRYLLKPNLATSWGLGSVQTNQYGLRDAHATDKKPGTFRLLAIGDSLTFGLGVDQADTFPRSLEKLLATAEPPIYEVINAGIPGYNLEDTAALLPTLLTRYEPDLVLWLVVPNDYDDSLGVDDHGGLSYLNNDYVVHNNLLSIWGFRGSAFDREDFRNSMSPEALVWAGASQPAHSALDDGSRFLFRYSRLASMLRHQLGSQFQDRAIAHERRVPFHAHYVRGDKTALWPTFAAIYSSQRARERGVQAIQQVRTLLATQSVPLAIVNTSLPLDASVLSPSHGFVYADLSTYLGQSFYEFLQHYQLGWDSHLGTAGNQLLARAIHSMLLCTLLSRADATCPAREGDVHEGQEYWAAYEEARKEFVAREYGVIDLDAFRGMHQILGGIGPPREFPSSLGQRAAVLLPASPRGVIEVVATPKSETSARFKAQVWHHGEVTTYEVEFSGERSVARLPLRYRSSATSEESHALLELELQCPTGSCPSVRIHRIGVLEPGQNELESSR